MTRRYKTAILHHTLLPLSETFIAEQIRHLRGVDLVVLGIRLENRDRFELPAAYVVNPEASLPGRIRELVYVATGVNRDILAGLQDDVVHPLQLWVDELMP